MYCNIVNGLTLKFEFNSGSTDRSPSFSSAFYYMLIYIYIYIYGQPSFQSNHLKKKKNPISRASRQQFIFSLFLACNWFYWY